MSDDKNKPRKAELVKSAPGKVTRLEPPPAQTSIRSRVSQLLYSPQREKKRVEAATQVIKAYTDLGEAHIELGRTADRFEDLDNILAADKLERDQRRMSLKNKLDAEQREANTKELQDAIHQEELSARLAEARAKRRQLEESLKRESTRTQKDEETLRKEAVRKMINRKLDSVHAVQEFRAEEARLIAEVQKRYGGVLSPDAEREIENIKDAVQRAIDEL